MSVREGGDAGREQALGYMRTWVRLKNAARVRESPSGASWYLAHEARDKTASRHGRCGLCAGRGGRQWVRHQTVSVWHMAQRSLGGAYLAAERCGGGAQSDAHAARRARLVQGELA